MHSGMPTPPCQLGLWTCFFRNQQRCHGTHPLCNYPRTPLDSLPSFVESSEGHLEIEPNDFFDQTRGQNRKPGRVLISEVRRFAFSWGILAEAARK